MIIINLGSIGDKFGDYRFDPQEGTKAAWIKDGVTTFGGNDDSASVFGGKRTVECFDFSKWLKTFKKDGVIVKMDIEGSEVPILEKMIKDKSIDKVHEFWIEWYDQIYPELKERSDRLREQINWKNWHTVEKEMKLNEQK